MAQSKEELISELFVQVELRLDSIIQMCQEADKTYETEEWNRERRLTLHNFDAMVLTAEGNNEEAKDSLLTLLNTWLFRVRFAQKLAELGVFILFDGPGRLLPIPGFFVQFLKENVYRRT
ncbi:AAA_9 domain-containing protein [Caenorhabditis elegans]|uniref:AAA_9 domain-containing protein n=1 Tax=Caenorhabditis elegans TaxID=6239 RepID=Q22760_CAEEL|nr:AAA_9 domain-containing protein [Caenorhabditis elegans]CCD65391.1 AAA_9 domain-containing protein [Caenorhabditis elegans]|eukprot:NP_509524.2 Uncharacterized protein CELE_T25B6.5 [Caenorhabditis elegans]